MAEGSRQYRFRAMAGVGAAALALGAGQAQATWSILIADTRTGEIGVASATCLTGFNLRHNTPVLITGVGAATAQSVVDQNGQNRGVIRDMLLQGEDPGDILAALEASDLGHDNRQYGMLDVQGRTLTYSGVDNAAWAGGQTGQVGDLVYAIQGNILTGAPVVQAAVDAVVMTPGDIPEKLMAAMEAAYLFGGDGRCSCDAGPTDCGSPPEDFEKSAHIGYMLIARTGDTDICNQIVDTRGVPTSFVIGDFDSDARVDAVVTTSSPTFNLGVLTNVTPAGAGLSALALREELFVGLGPVSGAGGDFTGDLVQDIVVAAQGDSVVRVYPMDDSGTLGEPVSTALAAGPVAVATGSFDGQHPDDVATVNTDGSVSVCLGAAGGAFDVSSVSPALSGPTAIVGADVDGDGDTDLALAHESLGVMSTLINDGSGGFSAGSFVFVGIEPEGVVSADFNSDGLDDLALPSGGGAGVSVLLNSGGGSFARTDVPSPEGRAVLRLASADMDGDGSGDLVAVLGAPQTLVALHNDGNGSFSFGEEAPIPTNLRSIGVGDFSGDGLDDVVLGAGGVGGLVMLENQGGGTFAQELGCAAGDYFMTFNVPNTISADPDPVFTLREMFDDWRVELVGRPDAVRSVVTGPSTIVASAEGPEQVSLRVELRDWQSDGVELDPSAISAGLGLGSDPVLEIGGVSALGGGAYEIQLIASGDTGRASVVITADDGARPVTLMPSYAIEVLDSRVDFDGDGVAGFGDVLAFLQAFSAQDPSADLDESTTFDVEDVLLFLSFFAL